MKEVLKEICKLIKETGRINRSIVSRVTGVLPLIRRLDSTQAEATKLRKTLVVELKKLGQPEKQLDQKLELFKEVARVLDSVVLKKRDLIAKLKELGVHLPNSFPLLLCQWKKEGLFNTSFGNGWYSLSAKGRAIVGLPPKPSRLEEPVQPIKSQKELEIEEKIISLTTKLGRALSETARLEAALKAATSKSQGGEIKPLRVVKEKKERTLSQLDLVVLGLFDVRPKKLKRAGIKSMLEGAGKTPTRNSLGVLLSNTGSRGMIVSAGQWGNKDYWLAEKGEARAEQLRGPKLPAEKVVDYFTLTQARLTEEHYDTLEKVYDTHDLDRQRLYHVQSGDGWTWWGLVDQFITPDQPLLGYLLKHEAFPESLELPAEQCFLKVGEENVWFDPSERADDRIVEFVKQNGKLPEQALA